MINPENEEFYKQCAELLGTIYIHAPFPYTHKTRWNNRKPGSGRFPNFGLIRKYGNRIHIMLRHPVNHVKMYYSVEDALAFLKSLSTESKNDV